jgi:ATP-dependent DNA ligase
MEGSVFPAQAHECRVSRSNNVGTRFRHTAQFKRWRPDREPESCTYEQLEEVARYDLDDVLA